MNLKHKLQIQFEEETKTPSVNSQKEFDIDYVYWLEKLASELKQPQQVVNMPSDEEIQLRADAASPYKLTQRGNFYEGQNKGFVYGAKWMRDTISNPTQQENNEVMTDNMPQEDKKYSDPAITNLKKTDREILKTIINDLDSVTNMMYDLEYNLKDSITCDDAAISEVLCKMTDAKQILLKLK